MTHLEQFFALVSQRADLEKALISVNEEVLRASSLIAESFRRGNKLLIFGNGGSAADSQHMAAEFVGKFDKERPGLPAIALTTDSSAITAIANDWEYGYVFQRQLDALGRSGDVALGITTSGNSANVIRALAHAKGRGLRTILLIGRTKPPLQEEWDVRIAVGGDRTPIIQERMLAVEHIICEMVESMLREHAISETTGGKTFYIDIDGTICVSTGGFYDRATSYPKRIARVNELYDQGNRIVYYTARGTTTGIDHRELTERQLMKWGAKYHELRLGKPEYHLWVDDKALNDADFFGAFKE